MTLKVTEYPYGSFVLERHGGAVTPDNLLDILTELVWLHDIEVATSTYDMATEAFPTLEDAVPFYVDCIAGMRPVDLQRKYGIEESSVLRRRRKLRAVGVIP